MTNDFIRVVFHLDPDPLLVQVLRGAVQFQGLQSGLSSGTCAEFADAFAEVCGEIISQLAQASGPLEVTLDTFQDRIEISIRHQEKVASAAGLDPFSERPEQGSFYGLELLSRVDRVLYSADGGAGRTTLVKFLGSKR
jgi:hypothetical protein